ncbi:MAG: hypothetical protein AAF725_27515, partial [Acidobacteriota bacterium]
GLEAPADPEVDALYEWIERFAQLTGSGHARGLLAGWERTRRSLRAVGVPASELPELTAWPPLELFQPGGRPDDEGGLRSQGRA